MITVENFSTKSPQKNDTEENQGEQNSSARKSPQNSTRRSKDKSIWESYDCHLARRLTPKVFDFSHHNQYTIFINLVVTKNPILLEQPWLRKDLLPVKINFDHKPSEIEIFVLIGFNDQIPTPSKYLLCYRANNIFITRETLLEAVRLSDFYKD